MGFVKIETSGLLAGQMGEAAEKTESQRQTYTDWRWRRYEAGGKDV